MMDSRARSNGRDLILAVVLAAITLWRLLPGVESTPFHRDEARWIGNSALLREWRHPLGIGWQDEGYANVYGTIDEVNRRRSQPPLAMYFIGAGLLLQGEGLPTTGYWIMSQDTDWNIDHGNMPSESQLHAARRTNVLAAVLTVIVVLAIGRRLTNRVGGVAGALVFAIHPLVLDTSTRAWSDPLLVLLIAVAALAAIRLADRPTWGRSAVLGVALGLGAATKLSPLPVAAGLGVVGAILWTYSVVRRESATVAVGKLGLRLAGVPFVAALTLVASYPYLWTNPISHTYRLFDFRARSFELQADSFPPAAVTDRADAVRRVVHELGERLSASGAIADWLEEMTGREVWGFVDYLDLVVAVAGLLLLVVIVARRGVASPSAMALAVLTGQTLLILATIKVEYARYLLPVLLAVAVLAGVAIGAAWQFGSSRWRGRRFGSALNENHIPQEPFMRVG